MDTSGLTGSPFTTGIMSSTTGTPSTEIQLQGSIAPAMLHSRPWFWPAFATPSAGMTPMLLDLQPGSSWQRPPASSIAGTMDFPFIPPHMQFQGIAPLPTTMDPSTLEDIQNASPEREADPPRSQGKRKRQDASPVPVPPRKKKCLHVEELAPREHANRVACWDSLPSPPPSGARYEDRASRSRLFDRQVVFFDPFQSGILPLEPECDLLLACQNVTADGQPNYLSPVRCVYIDPFDKWRAFRADQSNSQPARCNQGFANLPTFQQHFMNHSIQENRFIKSAGKAAVISARLEERAVALKGRESSLAKLAIPQKLQCHFCGNEFSRKDATQRHLKKCAARLHVQSASEVDEGLQEESVETEVGASSPS